MLYVHVYIYIYIHMYILCTISQNSDTFQGALQAPWARQKHGKNFAQKNSTHDRWLILTGNVDGLSTGKMHPGRGQSWVFGVSALRQTGHRWIEKMDYIYIYMYIYILSLLIIFIVMLKRCCHGTWVISQLRSQAYHLVGDNPEGILQFCCQTLGRWGRTQLDRSFSHLFAVTQLGDFCCVC